MIAGRWLVACTAIAACSDPAAPAGPRVVRTERTLAGMAVYHRATRTLVRDDGSVVMTTGRRVDPHTPRTPAVFVDDEVGAIRRAAAGASVERARARKVWYPFADQLVAAWVVEAYTTDPDTTLGDLVRTVITADGRVIARDSLVADAAYTYTVFADATGEQRPFDGPTQDATPHPTGVPDGSFPPGVAPRAVTVESRNGSGDPWLGDGATETIGNNVDAYADLYAPTGLGDNDFRAAAIGATFPYSYDTSMPPLASTEQQMASVTSLFYVLNWLHDFWYDAGFTETAGNAQASNYGRGGLEGDVLLAEAQDNALGGSRNNANMATPEDGMSPRMQVFVWTGKDTRSFTVTPSGDEYVFGTSAFGPRGYDVTAEIVVADDGAGPSPRDGCTALVNDVVGKLVLVDRGECTYKLKTTHAEAAGAVGVIIANNVASTTPPGMGDDESLAEPTIATVSLTQDAGAELAAQVTAGTVTASIVREVAPDLDGSLDATLVAHEFGHYLHHRLSQCGTTMCRALSEGWGDFVALLLMARHGDELRGAFPFSIYATQGYQEDPGYFGIRRAPYSADPAINALSFRHMADGEPLPTAHPILDQSSNAEVHNAGEVWAAALWEVYVALLEDGATRGLAFGDIRAKLARYVVTGLSLVPEEASPLETRDALLAAALAEDPLDFPVMAAAFARRGFGSCAVAPPASSITFVGIVESTRIAGNPQLVAVDSSDSCDEDGILDAGETTRFTVQVANHGHVALTDLTFDVRSALPGVTVLSPPVVLGRLEALATTELVVEVALADTITTAAAADLALTVTATNGCAETIAFPIATRVNIDDVRNASTTDTFDALASFWEPWSIAWSHVRETPLDGMWHGADLSSPSDTRLTSPRLMADADRPLTIRFAHRYAFEQSAGKSWDGGVIEYTVDDGASWADIATLAAPGYTGALTDEPGNVLGLRDAYVGTNAAWPAFETVNLDLGTALAGQAFRIRFRIGTDAATGGPGWDIDDVAFDGIVGTPFPEQRVDDGACTDPELPVDDPIRSGGGGCCDSRGSANNLFALPLLLFVRRRRYRARDGK